MIQIRLRLLLLCVALVCTLLATYSAYHFIGLSQQAELRMKKDARLQSDLRWRRTLVSELRGESDPRLAGLLRSTLQDLDQRIDQQKAELGVDE